MRNGWINPSGSEESQLGELPSQRLVHARQRGLAAMLHGPALVWRSGRPKPFICRQKRLDARRKGANVRCHGGQYAASPHTPLAHTRLRRCASRSKHLGNQGRSKGVSGDIRKDADKVLDGHQ
jgi:hypothetical protein